jgi:predicted metalloprotease with PDZ domain
MDPLKQIFVFVALFSFVAEAEPQPITLDVDATQARRGIFHSHLVFPAQPGALTLTYPKWIPGEHSPFGPIQQLTGLKFIAGDQVLSWQRDPIDLFAFHLTVPGGVTALQADFDYLSPPESFGDGYGEEPNATEHMLIVLWNQQVLAPQGVPSDSVRIRATLHLPPGWRFDTALPLVKRESDVLEFAESSLTTLVDSPVLAGDRFRTIDIAGGEAPVRMSLAANDAADLGISAERVAQFSHAVEQAQALFGARHYRSYVWLVALSDVFGINGLEHHESSDNRMPARLFREAPRALAELRILPHEYVHSWNGKFRRPAGLATKNYEEPMDGSLLWVYEGLTRYLGDILLTSRSGLRDAADTRDYLAWMAGTFQDGRPGRAWRSVADTASSAQILLGAPPAWAGVRRQVDYYDEGALLWLETDVLIRQQSHGAHSLDDFCRRFFGEPGTGPEVKPYVLDDLLAALHEVLPYDWRAWFQHRVYQAAAPPPLGGLTNAGWRLVYDAEPNQFSSARAVTRKQLEWIYDLGFRTNPDGKLLDVLPGSLAFSAGLDAGWKIMGINGAKWSPEAMHAALVGSPDSTAPLEFLLESSERLRTVKIDYRGGAKNPHLERVPGIPDLLSEILAPRAMP